MEGDDATAATDAAGFSWTPRWLAAARKRPNRRRSLLLAAALLGLALAWIHWLGLFVAGALVGFASRTLPRALAAGLAVGLLVLAVHVLASPVMSVGELASLTPLSYVTIGLAVVVPLWGSLVRAVV
jgi:hypothetical protein